MSSGNPNPPPKIPLPVPDYSNSIDGQVVGNYRIEKTIGQGTYGKVKLAYHTVTNAKFAIKIIEKAQLLNSKQIARLQREIRFLKLLHHPHIVKVYDVIETSDTIYIAMEYEAGGELFDYIVAHKRVKEKEARKFFRMVLSAVDYCHKNSVIHRDLKPENLLLDETKNIKIIDFGFGNNFTADGLLDTFCGSPFYAAPEMILGKKYEGPEVDMWSLGVILFALLCGHLPFDDDNIKELYKKIATGNFVCPDYLMPNARHLISRLITVDPKERATLEEVLSSEWVNEGYTSQPQNYLPERPVITDPNELSKEIVNRILAFGYTNEDVLKAFSPEADQSKPNPVRSTYFLLLEMLQREEARFKSERKPATLKRLDAKPKSISVNSLGNSLSKIEEDSGLSAEQISSKKSVEGNARHIGKTKPFVSMHILTGPFGHRRSSTPDAKSRVGSSLSPISPIGAERKDNRPYTASGSAPVSAIEANSASTELALNHAQFSSRRPSQPQSPGGSYNTIRRGSLGGKVREELRAVSGWFLNVSTTSSKNPTDIIAEVVRVLKLNSVSYKIENSFIIICEVDIDTLVNDLHTAEEGAKKGVVGFQIEVCKVPKMTLNGLNFKRLSGGVWNYKKVCNKLLHQMNL